MTLTRLVCAYWYDPHIRTARITSTRAALVAGARLYYAVKANSHLTLLHTAAALTAGCEVASAGELAKALSAGAPFGV